MLDTLKVKPITYKLNISDEELKKMRPFFKLSSGSYSRITKTIKHPHQGDPKFDQEVHLKKKEKGSVCVELWDRNSSRPENLIGRGEIKYTSFDNLKGNKFEEWIPLLDRNNKEVGKALVEINIIPMNQNLSIEDMFSRSLNEIENTYRRAIEDFRDTFESFGKFALPSETKPQLTTGTEKMKGESEDKIMTYRRSVFDNAFDDIHNMFARTIEEMHNTFERMTREMLEGPSMLGGDQTMGMSGTQGRGMEVEGMQKGGEMGKKEVSSKP